MAIITNSKEKYRHIIKTTSIFGGVQVFQLLIGLIRLKFVALFIGKSGLGEISLYNSSLNTVNFLVSLGLTYSATRLIAKANAENNIEEINNIYNIVTKWTIVTSILGTFLFLFLSINFNLIIIKSSNIAFLSSSIILTALANKNNIFLQGMNKYKELAKSTLYSSFIALIISIPFFYIFKDKGIVPSIIATSIIVFIVSEFFKKNVSVLKYKSITIRKAYLEGVDMVKLGIIMMLASLIGSIVTNYINFYITKTGSLSDLGLYNAAYNISVQYVGLIFVAMSTEFFPRLSSISTEEKKVIEMVNQQTEITLLIIAPILSIMIITSNLIIKIALSNDFNAIVPFIQITSFSLIFQSLAYTISNIPIAKGDKKIFFIFNSLIPGICAAVFITLGYKYFGLKGIAIAIICVNISHFTAMFSICYVKYNFSFTRKVKTFAFFTLLLTIATYFSINKFDSTLRIFISTLMFFSTILFSLYNLNKLLDLKDTFNHYLSKIKLI